MKASTENKASNNLHLKETHSPFFKKNSGEDFFSDKTNALTGKDPFFSPHPIQPKLTIGQADDPCERQADAVADQVVQRLSDPTHSPAPTGLNPQNISQTTSSPPAAKLQQKESEEGLPEEMPEQEEGLQKKAAEDYDGRPPAGKLQRKCVACTAEENAAVLPQIQARSIFESNEALPAEGQLQRKCAACQEEEIRPQRIQRKETGAPLPASSGLESRLNASKGSGDRLPDNARGSMETAFGTDFSSVRVHNDSRAVQMNRELGAQAFTHGSDIYFNSGKYDTASKGGQHLLAHELTHVVQQGGSSKISPQRNPSAPGLQLLEEPEITSPPSGFPCPTTTDHPTLEDNDLRVNFRAGSSSISPEDQQTLADLATYWMVSGGGAQIRLDGYSSADGGARRNWVVSCERVQSVKDALTAPTDERSGIPENSIEWYAHGETDHFSTQSYGPNRKVTIKGLQGSRRSTAQEEVEGTIVNPGDEGYNREFLGALVLQYVGNNYLFLAESERYVISPSIGQAYNYGRLFFGVSDFAIIIGGTGEGSQVGYFTVPLEDTVPASELNPRPISGAEPTEQGIDGSVLPHTTGNYPILGVFLEHGRFLVSATLRQNRFIRAQIQAELQSGVAQIATGDLDEIVESDIFGPIDDLIDQDETQDAAERLAGLDATAFALIDWERKARYVAILLEARTYQAQERAIVEIFRSTQSLSETEAIFEHLRREGLLHDLLTDLDYEKWNLFEVLGEKFGAARPLTFETFLDFLSGFGIGFSPVSSADDLLDQIHTVWDSFLDFFVGIWDALVMIVTEPDKVLQGIGAFIKMMVMMYLAQDISLTVIANAFDLEDLQDLQAQAREYMDNLLASVSRSVKNTLAGIEITGMANQLGSQLRWVIVWEVISMFIGVGEIKAALTAARATARLRTLRRVLRILDIADDAADAARYTERLGQIARAIDRVSDVIRAEDEVLRLLSHLPDNDIRRLRAAIDGLDVEEITDLRQLGDIGIEIQRKTEILGTLSGKAGGLSDEVVQVFQQMVTRFDDLDEVADVIRLVDEADGALFVQAVRMSPGADLSFYRLLAQNRAHMTALTELGYESFARIARTAAARGEDVGEYIRAINRLRESLPEGTSAAQFRRFLDNIEPVNLETYDIFIDNPALIESLINNPRAARLLRRCSSPCFPPNMEEIHIERIERAIDRANRQGIEVDEGRLTDYLYENRANLDDISRQLETNPRQLVDLDVHRLSTEEIIEALGPAGRSLDDLQIQVFLDAGFPSRELVNVLRQGSDAGKLDELVQLLNNLTFPRPNRLGNILDDLAQGGREFELTFDFLERVDRNQEQMLGLVDELYDRFDNGSTIAYSLEPQRGNTFQQFSLDNLSENSLRGTNDDWYDFVLTEGDELRLGSGHFHLADEAHSVKMAGQVRIENGRIHAINNGSGHYRPDALRLREQAARNLGPTGLLADDFAIIDLGF